MAHILHVLLALLLASVIAAEPISINFTFVFLNLTFTFLGVILDPVKCGKNEQYVRGTSSVETCTSKPPVSLIMTAYGCFCMNGYIRQSDKTGSLCITRAECPVVKDPPVCGKNEEYTTCGSACPATCNDLRYPLPKPPKICILICKSGCFCMKGYYRADDGTCVAPDQCCNDNEKYKTCGSACVDTCDYKASICTKQCVAGCFCACTTYVRQSNSTGSPCIPRDDCPKACNDDNEQ